MYITQFQVISATLSESKRASCVSIVAFLTAKQDAMVSIIGETSFTFHFTPMLGTRTLVELFFASPRKLINISAHVELFIY